MLIREYFGMVNYNDLNYNFVFKDNILTITQQEMTPTWKTIFSGWDKRIFNGKLLHGVTHDNYPIVFIDVQFINKGGGVLQAYVPDYIKGTSNAVSPLPEITDFNSMVFYGECIDNLYNPQNIIKEREFSEDGKTIMNFCSIKEVVKEYKFGDDKLLVGISTTFNYKNKRIPLLTKSYLEIKFLKKKNIHDIIEYYHIITNFFRFINNRKYIMFTDVYLNSDMYVESFDNEIKNIGTKFEMYINFSEDIKIDLPNIIYQKHLSDLNNKFIRLIEVINNEKGHKDYYPMNKSDENYVDVNKFIKIASSFESWFDIVWPKFKSDTDKVYNSVKTKVLDYIENLGDYTNSKGRDYLKRFKNEIEKMEGNLNEQLKYSYDKFKCCFEKVEHRNRKYYQLESTKITDLFSAFSKKRNKLSHGDMTDLVLKNEEILAYIIVERLIQCMIYYKAEFDINEIQKLVDEK